MSTSGLSALIARFKSAKGSLRSLEPKSLAWRIREPFYQHLSDQVANDIALETSLKFFQDRMVRQKRPGYAKLIAVIISRLKNGDTFAQSLRGLVPENEIIIISAGELSSRLPFALSLILEQQARKHRLTQTLRQGLASSVGHLLIAVAVLWYLASAVIPQLTMAVPEAQAQGLVSALYKVSSFINSYWALSIPIGIIVFIAAIFYTLPRWTGPSRLVAEQYFPWSYYRDLVGYQWLMIFTTLLASGISDVTILKTQSKEATPYLRERLTLLFHRLHSGGMSLGDALITPIQADGLSMNFPSPEINESIVALYGFANFPKRIITLVEQWAKQIEERTLTLAKKVSAIFEFVMIFGMALLILAVQDLSNQVGMLAK
ncbi:type II secretion system F family protein [Polynucleobacter sp. 86C-FISCH]|uniref:type II secretion system F family protein n=1 Tax=Polynucleobacter sp. 86C-FISCH TaxID=2689101 RepID=UPI001C0CDBEB|nr:type II secretion system F family protein [Polynucleobacter sp. 86C-FISCH]MBU3595093.1 type II secretion system F family protein [Polynucleobacter sp. 86C-FISCH]